MAQKHKPTIESFTQEYVLWLAEKLITHGDNYFQYVPNSFMFGHGIAKGHLKFPPRPMRYDTKEGKYVYFTKHENTNEVRISRAGKEFLELNHG